MTPLELVLDEAPTAGPGCRLSGRSNFVVENHETFGLMSFTPLFVQMSRNVVVNNDSIQYTAPAGTEIPSRISLP
jgi:hypothetical protein